MEVYKQPVWRERIVMSWLSSILRQSKESTYINSISKIFVLFLGKAGKDIWELSREAVVLAENDTTLTDGAKKFEYVYKYVVSRIRVEALPYFWNYFAKAAIELAVFWLKEYVVNKMK